jgi:ankyrin repeat protein
VFSCVFYLSGDLNCAFLLLHWGANPNNVDNMGDSPLMWIIKNRTAKVAAEFVGLLLKFGANPLLPDIHKDTALHLMAEDRNFDASIAFVLYRAAGPTVISVENRNGMSIFKVSLFLLSVFALVHDTLLRNQ